MGATGSIQRIEIIDSHTAGEPTRVVVGGGPELGDGSLIERIRRFRQHFDGFRSAVVNEPRGSEVVVGALLLAPLDPQSAAGVIFFNNTGYLGMCGHGTIGLVTTLAHLGRIAAGVHAIETPVGLVKARLNTDGMVSVENVPAYCHAEDVEIHVPEIGKLRGDIAWGGNWFFLIDNHPFLLEKRNVQRLTSAAWSIRHALRANGITGADDQEIDHIELCGPPTSADADSKNFVLCPGGAYDRSPCGTGTSAKLACLAAKGTLQPGQVWRQESIIGSLFEASYELHSGRIIPMITGRAFINSEATLLLDPADPFCMGIG